MKRPNCHTLQRRLSYANVIATLALFFALTGGAMAGVKYLTASDAITTGDLAGSTYGDPVIASGQVTSAKIADGAVTSSKFDTAAIAPNAAKLDGLASTAFLSGYQVVEQNFTDPYNPNLPDITNGGAVASCPSGKQVIGGGVFAEWLDSTNLFHSNVQVDDSQPWDTSGTGTYDAWSAAVSKPDGSPLVAGEEFAGTVYAICASTAG